MIVVLRKDALSAQPREVELAGVPHTGDYILLGKDQVVYTVKAVVWREGDQRPQIVIEGQIDNLSVFLLS